MSESRFIVKSFGQFFRYRPARLVGLFLITLFQGLSQGITIVMLIPLLGLIDPSQAEGSTNTWAGFLEGFLKQTGIGASLELILVIFAVCLVLIALLTYFQSIIQSSYQQEFSYHTRKRLFRKIIGSDWEYLNGRSKFNHIQVLTTEIPKMTLYYHSYLSLAIKAIFIIAHVVLALMISVRFTLLVVIAGLIIVFLLRNYLKKSEILGKANIRAFRDMLKRIDDFWTTVKIAKVHNSEAFYYKKFAESNEQMLHYQNKQVRNRAIPQFLFTLAGTLLLVTVIYVAYRVASLPVASLFVLILLFARMFPQFMGVNNDLSMLISLQSSVQMVLETERDIPERGFGGAKTTGKIGFNHELKIEGLNFAYDPGKPLFVNFSETIPAGKITGLIGNSGCGKTTLIDIIAGLLNIEQGTLSVDGKVLGRDNLTEWRSELGYLPQDAFFIDGTIRENLIWDTNWNGGDARLEEVLRLVNASDLIASQKQGLDTLVANYQYHFSGGERQRLALARVLLRNPRLLLLDEATSSLDPENEALVMDSLLHLRGKVTIVFVTHRENLQRYFDKIIDLNNRD